MRMQGGKRPPVCSRDHQVRQLWKAPRGAGRRLRLQESGPPVCQEVAIAPSPTRGAGRGSVPPEAPTSDTTAAQEGEVSGEAGVEVGEREGPA